MRIFYAAILAILLAACMESPQQSAPSTNEVVQEVAATAPLLLEPIFISSMQCLTQCKTLFLSLDGKREPDFPFELPKMFKDLLGNKNVLKKFDALVKELPTEYQKIGLRQPSDATDKEFTGEVSTIILDGERKIYVYVLAGYQRPNSSYLTVAVDSHSKEMSALLRPTADHDEYYLVGASALQPALLDYIVSGDLSMAFQGLKVARNPELQYDFSADPAVFPFSSEKAAALSDWLVYLNSRYTSPGRLSGVGSPPDSVEAQRLKKAAQWYAADLNFSGCISSMSPGKRIENIQDAGLHAATKDRFDSAGNLVEVEVAFSEGSGERYYTYYKDKEACEAALPQSKQIPDRYR